MRISDWSSDVCSSDLKAREIGAKIKFDREVGAYELVTEGLAKKDVTALKAGLSDFVGKAAKARWDAERTEFQASRDALRAELKAREGTTTEPKPERETTRAREERLSNRTQVSQQIISSQ